jgi:valyl-tRNA synthetase
LEVLVKSMAMISIACPFFAEVVYEVCFRARESACALPAHLPLLFPLQNLRQRFPEVDILRYESVTLVPWPEVDKELHVPQFEERYGVALDVLAAILAARKQASMAVKFASSRVFVQLETPQQAACVHEFQSTILRRANVRELVLVVKGNVVPPVSLESAELVSSAFPAPVARLNLQRVGPRVGTRLQSLSAFVEAHSEAVVMPFMTAEGDIDVLPAELGDGLPPVELRRSDVVVAGCVSRHFLGGQRG